MNKLLKAAGVILIPFLSIPVSLAATFSDVPTNNDYYIAVESLNQAGIIQGYEDGTFKPDQNVNRAEALKMILKSANIQPSGGLYNTGFPDVPIDSWYAGYVMEGVLRGIINGNPDGTYAGARTVNRAEFIKMMLQTYFIDLSKHQNLATAVAPDVPAGQWYTPHLSYAQTIGLVYPDLNYNLYPSKELSRGECVQIIYKMLLVIQGGEGQKLLSIAETKLVMALLSIHHDDIDGALANAAEAKSYSEKAAQIDPDSSVTLATKTIARAFEKLFQAYQAGLSQDSLQVVTLVQEAKALADDAKSQNESAAYFANKVYEHGDDLIDQLT